MIYPTGIPIPVTWTHLAESVEAGDTEMTLMLAVTWNVGDEFVIASTGHRHSQRENEFLTITGEMFGSITWVSSHGCHTSYHMGITWVSHVYYMGGM